MHTDAQPPGTGTHNPFRPTCVDIQHPHKDPDAQEPIQCTNTHSESLGPHRHPTHPQQAGHGPYLRAQSWARKPEALSQPSSLWRVIYTGEGGARPTPVLCSWEEAGAKGSRNEEGWANRYLGQRALGNRMGWSRDGAWGGAVEESRERCLRQMGGHR